MYTKVQNQVSGYFDEFDNKSYPNPTNHNFS